MQKSNSNRRVWVSKAPIDTSLIKSFTSDLFERDKDCTIKAATAVSDGVPLPREDYPTEIYADYALKPAGPQPDIFRDGNFLIISAVFADVLSQFDLGKTCLYPVEVFEHDRETPVGGYYKLLALGERKRAFRPEHSDQTYQKKLGKHDIWSYLIVENDTIAVDASALDGPDLWVDPRLIMTFFLSDRLAKALRAAKVARRLKLKSCKVVEI